MFAKRKFFTVFLLAFAMMIVVSGFSLTACSESKTENIEQNGSEATNQTIPNEENCVNGMKHYEIALNMQNFEEFLVYEYTYSTVGIGSDRPNSKGHSYLVSGVLSFAYYKNVVVTFRIARKDTNQYKDYQVKLNAAGNGGFYQVDEIYKDATTSLGSSNFTVSIQNVNGMVLFLV